MPAMALSSQQRLRNQAHAGQLGKGHTYSADGLRKWTTEGVRMT